MKSELLLTNGFTLFGLNIKFYGIIMAFAMLVGVILACVNGKKKGFTSDNIILLACYALPLAVIGARVYYVLFSLDKYTNFWDVFKIWEGGLAIYGGVIGGAIGVGLYCLIHKKNFLKLADIIVPSLILGQAIGRWGNFFNQEAYGYEITNPSFQWFPVAVYIESTGTWHMATFFYESLWNLIVFGVLMLMLYKSKIKEDGVLMSTYLILYGIGRVVIEGFRTDSLYLGSVRISQLLSGLLVVFGVAYICIVYGLKYSKKRKQLLKLGTETDHAKQDAQETKTEENQTKQ